MADKLIFVVTFNAVDPNIVIGNNNEIEPGRDGFSRNLGVPFCPIRVGRVHVDVSDEFVHEERR